MDVASQVINLVWLKVLNEFGSGTGIIQIELMKLTAFIRGMKSFSAIGAMQFYVLIFAQRPAKMLAHIPERSSN